MMRKCQDGSNHWSPWRESSELLSAEIICVQCAWKRTNFGVPHSLLFTHKPEQVSSWITSCNTDIWVGEEKQETSGDRISSATYLSISSSSRPQGCGLHSEDSLLHLLLSHGDWETSLDLRKFWRMCRASTMSFWELSLSILGIILALSWLLKLIWTNSLAFASSTFALPLKSGHVSRGKLAHRLK